MITKDVGPEGKDLDLPLLDKLMALFERITSLASFVDIPSKLSAKLEVASFNLYSAFKKGIAIAQSADVTINAAATNLVDMLTSYSAWAAKNAALLLLGPVGVGIGLAGMAWNTGQAVLYAGLNTWNFLTGNAGNLTESQRKARSYNTSIGGVRSFEINASKYINDPDALLANAATAMTSEKSAQANAARTLGLDPTKFNDSTQLASAIVEKLHEQVIAWGALGILMYESENSNLLALVSLSDLRNLIHLDKGFSEKVEADRPRYEMSDVDIGKVTEFYASWKQTVVTWKATVLKFVADLSPSLTKVSEWMNTLMSEIFLNVSLHNLIVDAIHSFIDWIKSITSQDVANMFNSLSTSISRLVRAISGKNIVFHTYTSQEFRSIDHAEKIATKGGIYSRVRNSSRLGGYKYGNKTIYDDKGPRATMPRDTRLAADYLMNRLMTKWGYSKEAAAILAGNAQVESGVRSDGPMGDPTVGGGIYPVGSWGMFQWNRQRLLDLQAYANSQGKSWKDRDVQIDFAAQEADRMIPGFKSIKSLDNAEYYSHRYEGYSTNTGAARAQSAQQFYRNYKDPTNDSRITPSVSGFIPVPPAKYHIFGDSLAVGIQQATGIEGVPVVGKNPKDVLEQIESYSGSLAGKKIILSTGLSNDTSMIATYLPKQIDALRKLGVSDADITVMGGGSRPDIAQASQTASDILKDAYPDIKFQPIDVPTPGMSGVHPTSQGYAQLAKEMMQESKGIPVSDNENDVVTEYANTPGTAMFADTTSGVESARKYLSSLSRNASRPGDISALHPVFALRLARTIKEARDAGMPIHIESAFRDTSHAQSSWDFQGYSAHNWGAAADLSGIGADGSDQWKTFERIAEQENLYNPYIDSSREASEFNHWQLLPYEIKAGSDTYKRLMGSDKQAEHVWDILMPYHLKDNPDISPETQKIPVNLNSNIPKINDRYQAGYVALVPASQGGIGHM